MAWYLRMLACGDSHIVVTSALLLLPQLSSLRGTGYPLVVASPAVLLTSYTACDLVVSVELCKQKWKLNCIPWVMRGVSYCVVVFLGDKEGKGRSMLAAATKSSAGRTKNEGFPRKQTHEPYYLALFKLPPNVGSASTRSRDGVLFRNSSK